MLEMSITPREILCLPRYVSATSGVAWCPLSQSHVCKKKNWMLVHSKEGRVKSRITLRWAGLKV